jgi:hypothetical protein
VASESTPMAASGRTPVMTESTPLMSQTRRGSGYTG